MATSDTCPSAINKATGDRVLPLRFWDSDGIYSKLALDFTFRFDDVLDTEKLHWSLGRLLQIGNWHQMGARYRKNLEGNLELHIPQEYDDSRPGIAWSHDDRHRSINEDDLASRMPQSANAFHPTLHEDSAMFEKLVTRSGRPTRLKQWTKSDYPALSIHVVSFTDATLITLSWTHVLFDALGRQSFLQAWQAVLNGREEEVPIFISYEEDPTVALAKVAMAEGLESSDHILYTSALTGIWWLLFIFSFIYEVAIHSQEAGRTVCFPGQWVDDLRDQAVKELRITDPAEQNTFLSPGDVLLAFWCKTTIAAQKLTSRQPVHIINAFNLRGMSDRLPVPGKTAYIGNGAMKAITLTTVAELEDMSVGQLAARIRADLMTQRAPKQVKSMVVWQYDCFRKRQRSPVAGSWNQIIFSWSNWSRAKFYEIDLSSAVKTRGLDTTDCKTKLGQPSFIMNRGHGDGISTRNGGPLIGQDANGNWWLNWLMRAEAWSEVEKILASTL